MMPEPFKDEVLSAYLDGELPADQRAPVERWLKDSADARRALAELQSASSALRDLPRSELPAEFASQVLQQAERQMLLPAAAATPPRPVRKWVLAAAPLAAVAAGLLVMLQLVRQQPARREARNMVARHEAFKAGDESRAGKASAPVADRDAAGVMIADANDGAAENATRGVPADVGEVAAVEREIDGAVVRQMVDAIRDVSDRGMVAVLRVSVVDRTAGEKLVQWALEQHQIGPDPSDDSQAGGKARTDGFAEKQAAPGRQIERQGLLVIAETEQLVAALQEFFNRQPAAQALEIARPIDLRALDEPGRQRALTWDQRLAATAKSGSDRSPANARTKNAPASGPVRVAAGASSAAPSKTRASDSVPGAVDKSPRDMASPPNGVQLVITLTDTNGIARKPVEPASKAFTGDAAAEGQSLPAAVPKEKVSSDRALVRVIILIEERATEEQRPAAPAKPANGDGSV